MSCCSTAPGCWGFKSRVSHCTVVLLVDGATWMLDLQDGASGAKTLLYHIQVDRGISWDMATGMLADDGPAKASAAPQVRCPTLGV